jgi:hypothetical protein
MFLDHGLTGFGSCFVGGVFGMPKRFHVRLMRVPVIGKDQVETSARS